MTPTAAGAPGSGDRITRGQALLWSGAALAVLAVHGGGAIWALRQPALLAAQAAAPTAVMIDLAPEPVAPEAVEEEEITPDLTDAPEIVSEPEDPLTPPAPDPLPAVALPAPEAPPPVLETPAPVQSALADVLPPLQPTVEPPPEQLSEVVEAPPPARPLSLRRPEPAKPEVTKREPAREPTRTAPSTAAKRAQVVAPPAATAAATQTSRGSSGAASAAKWQSRLLAHLERRKRYPSGARSRREEGVAYVRFAIDDTGTVLSVQLARSSGHPDLDEAVVALVRRASPVPAPPPGAPREITAPVQFRIR